MRVSWDQYFMDKAEHASTRATCERLSVGAILVKKTSDGKLVDIMTGYNGSLPGHPHCTDVGCLMHEGRCQRTIHAEMNLVDRCARFGIATEGAVVYTTHYPCPTCMQHLANVGIAEVVYKNHYTHKFENDFHHGMNLRQFTGDSEKITHVFTNEPIKVIFPSAFHTRVPYYRLKVVGEYLAQIITNDRYHLSVGESAPSDKDHIFTYLESGGHGLDFMQDHIYFVTDSGRKRRCPVLYAPECNV